MFREETQEEKDKRIKEHVDKLLSLFSLETTNLSESLEDDYHEEEKTSDYMLLQSHDPMDIEKITIGYYLNNWKVPRFYGIVQRFDKNNDEVTTSDSFGCLWDSYDPEMEDDCPHEHPDCENCNHYQKDCDSQYSKDLAYALSNKPHEEVTEWCSKPKKFICALGTDIEYEYVADSFVCYNNITHYHTIKGYQFRIDSQDLEEIVKVLETRNLWFKVEPFLSQEAEV